MGEGHLQGKTEFGKTAARSGTSVSNDLVTSPRRPFPPPAETRRAPLRALRLVTLFSLVCRASALALGGEEGHWGGP